ncbi:hypothetical protein [Streptomyces sp. NPDC046332]|uniref:hypothetical protein n=1 Tax=Streptomyces sp. NPDC046332 TaxID=3155133 RepID=UPI0033DBCA29
MASGSAELSPAELSRAELSPAELSPAELSRAELSRAELSPAGASCAVRGFRGAPGRVCEGPVGLDCLSSW